MVTDAAVPEVADGQLRVRVQVRPINPSDLLYVRGQYGRQPHFPTSPVGFEGAGVIETASPARPDLPVEATYDLSGVLDAVAHAIRSGQTGKILLTG